jgi:hypothetical protein
VINASTAEVSGTHRSAKRGPAGLWVGFATVQAFLAVLSYRDGRGSHAAAFVIGTGLGLAVAWLLWSQRTVIDAQGLRVKVGWRWRDLTWDEVKSVDAPSGWSPTQLLAVTMTGGEVIATHVPAALHEDLVAYAAQHRSPRHRRPIEPDDDAP